MRGHWTPVCLLHLTSGCVYVSHTRDLQRFTISEVAADWHEPVVLQCIMWPSIANANKQMDHGAASRHNIASISHTWPSPCGRLHDL